MSEKFNVILLGDSTIDNIVWVKEQNKTVSGCIKEKLNNNYSEAPFSIVKKIIDELSALIISDINKP